MIIAGLLAIFVLAAASPWLSRYLRPALGPLACVTLATVGASIVFGAETVEAGAAAGTVAATWAEELGVTLSWRVDGLAKAFVVLICGVGSLVMLYAGSYMGSKPRMGTFFATLLAFAGSMLGLVLAENLILLFIFWELTSITSYLLIGFDYDKEKARRDALQALLVTGSGGLALLAGLILLGIAAGGFEIGNVLDAGMHGELMASPLLTPAIVLVLLGCLTKSANVPFHFWLPNAMSAPSPVSALLHSSTMVKAGVYLAARLHPGLAESALWSNSLIVFGGVTMVYGAFFATRRDEFKKILAYSTVSSLGILMMLIGLGAAKAAAAYLLAHAMFKGALFLIAGSVIKKTGTKKPESLGGLRSSMPVTAAASIVAAVSMGGMAPVVAGFAGKELMLKEALASGAWAVPVVLAVMVTAVLTIMAALVVGLRPYVGDRPAGLEHAVEPPLQQVFGPVVLGVCTILSGTAAFLGFDQLVTGVIGSIEGHAHEPVQAGALGMFFKGLLTLPLLLSVIAVVGGIALYRYRWHYQSFIDAIPVRIGVTFDAVYDGLVRLLNMVAKAQTRALQNGSLRWYVRMTFLGSLVLIGLALLRPTLPALPETAIRTSSIIDWSLALIIAVAAIAAVLQRKALASIAVLGTVGFVGALVFLLYGAVDVAMTQLATETLIVIIFVLVIYHLPRFSRLTSMRGRVVDALIAGGVGLVMGVLTLAAVVVEPAGPRISAYHAENSYVEAYGRNIVNVILVDFRGFDTLGEIFVLGAAAVGLYTMLRPSRAKGAVTTDAAGSISGEGSPTGGFGPAGGTPMSTGHAMGPVSDPREGGEGGVG